MEILSLFDHSGANKRHEVFAANKATQATNISLVTDQICSVAWPPNRSLHKCRNGFAMSTKNFAGSVDEEECVVDSMYTWARVHFVAADHNISICIRSSVAESTGVLAWNQQSFVVELDSNGTPIL